MLDLTITANTPTAATAVNPSYAEKFPNRENTSTAATAAVLYSQEFLLGKQSIFPHMDTAFGRNTYVLRMTQGSPNPGLGVEAAWRAWYTSHVETKASRILTSNAPLVPSVLTPFRDFTEAVVQKVVADLALVFLDSTVEEKDEESFLSLGKLIDWPSRPATDFMRVIHLALKIGALQFARELAEKGMKYFPNDPALQKAARVLAPPKVVRRDVAPDPAVRANREWLSLHAKSHKGKWVALRNGELIAVAESFRDLAAQIGETNEVLLTKV